MQVNNDINNWKSKSESMLSQLFIDDSDAVDNVSVSKIPCHLPSPPQPEKCSISTDADHPSNCFASSHCIHDQSAYERLLVGFGGCSIGLGRRCAIGGGGGYCCSGILAGGEGGSSPCLSLFLQWTKFVRGSAMRTYLSSPVCLALLPLVVGVVIGFFVGRRHSDDGSGSILFSYELDDSESGGPTTLSTLPAILSRLYHRLSLRAMLVALNFNPRRRALSASVLFQDERDDRARDDLRRMIKDERESGVDPRDVPCHIAVIMDGNRRYGESKYGHATRGHWDGSKTLIEFSKWCISEGVQVLTVYAFSTENWNRDPYEISALMSIFCKYCDELRLEAIKRGIRIRVLATESERIPDYVRAGIDRMVLETSRSDKFAMNICLSYGGRGEIANACKGIAEDVRSGKLDVDAVDEDEVRKRLLTRHCCDPDVVIRTSGEERLSNFLLWQVAYSEFFFLKKHWPELQKDDLLEVIRTFARGRKRRFGR